MTATTTITTRTMTMTTVAVMVATATATMQFKITSPLHIFLLRICSFLSLKKVFIAAALLKYSKLPTLVELLFNLFLPSCLPPSAAFLLSLVPLQLIPMLHICLHAIGPCSLELLPLHSQSLSLSLPLSFSSFRGNLPCKFLSATTMTTSTTAWLN